MIAETTPVLSLLFAKGLGIKTLSGLVDRMLERHLSVDELAHLPPDHLVREYGLRRSVAEGIQAAHEEAARVGQELERCGVHVLIRGIEPYPAKLVEILRENAPPVLFARGSLSILDKMMVGFSGARNASEKGIRVAGDSARLLAARDVNIVSGYAKGIDLSAHRAALDAGGVTTIVLAEGILRFREKWEVRSLLNDNNHLVLSEFSPRCPWTPQNAMQRNKTICGLSDAMIVIESGMRGGTFAAAEAALKLDRPLFVVEYAQPAASAEGNRYFLERGAAPLRGNREGQPNLHALFEILGLSADAAAPDDAAIHPSAATTESVGERGESYSPHSTVSQANAIGAAHEERMNYPKRLIEVDLPIRRISAHARREKSIRHGHISTLHIWWARRPLAACRAVICAALWPDPADPLCPQSFRDDAAGRINAFAAKASEDMKLLGTSSEESKARWLKLAKPGKAIDPREASHLGELRAALLDFIADFSNWDNSTVPDYLDTSRALTQAAHEALGGAPGTRPLVVDPFAGGGSIPLEALRVGADAFASDLNPVAVLLNKVVLEYIPKYGQRLADEVRKWGAWIKQEAEKELAEFYPKDPDGATPIAYLWARTIQCEGPGCGAEVPLIRSLWLAKKASRAVALQLVPKERAKRVDFKIIIRQHDGWVEQDDLDTKIADPKFDGTVKRGSATCPCCGYTTSVPRVREQLRVRRGGSDDARLICILTLSEDGKIRRFRQPCSKDHETAARANAEVCLRQQAHEGSLSLVPDEEISLNEIRRISVPIYGMSRWGDMFSPRQKLTLTTITRLVADVGAQIDKTDDLRFARAVQAGLGCVLSKVLDRNTAVARWEPNVQCSQQVFGRQAIAMVWDFGETALLVDCAGSWPSLLDVWLDGLSNIIGALSPSARGVSATVEAANAAAHPLPDKSADAIITDPPYYDAVPYAHLSDFFYVWQRRHLRDLLPSIFSTPLGPKEAEIVVDRPHELSTSVKDVGFYERELTKAFADSRRLLKPDALGTIVFASKSTASWEAILTAIVEAGCVICGSWPIDTEMETRMNAMGTATLASSVHIVVRPRESPIGSLRSDGVGDWRQVLGELPRRIHEWMPRLASEGIVGADAIFACLGPALEIFSRYSRVERASGEVVTLREYLEEVWAAVSTEALSMIFKDADAAGLEPDARLTAMWLWTLGGGANGNGAAKAGEEKDEDLEATAAAGKAAAGGFTLEYDAARKIAQGLGVHLEKIPSVVEVKGDKARLRAVGERTKHLFGKDEAAPTTKRRKKKSPQKTLFDDLEEVEASEGGWSELQGPPLGATVLDRVHQAMILFAAGRSEAIKRFLIEDGAGTDARFWKLTQSLSALYPQGSDEKRWVDGVLARKKGWGL